MTGSSAVRQLLRLSFILVLLRFVTGTPSDLGCKGGDRGSRVTLNMAKIDTKCRDLPHVHPFKFDRDGIDFYNFAAMQINQLQVQDVALPDDQWVAALGSDVDTRGRVLANSTAYISLRPDSRAQFFRLYSLRFFCMKQGSPTSCTVGYRMSNIDDADHNVPRPVYVEEYIAARPSKLGTLWFPGFANLRFVSLGIPVAELKNGAQVLPPDGLIPDSEWSSGVTAYVLDLEYSTPKCKTKTPKSDSFVDAMAQLAKGC